MTDSDDDLARLLRRLRSTEPEVGSSVDDVIGNVRHRVVRRQQLHRAAAGALAVIAAVALVALPSRIGGAGDDGRDRLANPASPGPTIDTPRPDSSRSAKPTVTARPDPGGGRNSGDGRGPRGEKPVRDPYVQPPTSGYDDHGCPLSWQSPEEGTPWLPAEPPALAAETLLPAGPSFLAVCHYPGGAVGPGGLAQSVSVRSGFTEMVAALGAEPATELAWCADESGADTYLVRANYPGSSEPVWIAVVSGSGCGAATNGLFSTAGSFAAGLSGVLANRGTWGGPYPGDCATTDARPGRDAQMVPTADLVRVFVCVSNPQPGQRTTTRNQDPATVSRLAAQLNSLPAGAGSPSCDPADEPSYLVNFRYDGAEDVSVRVVPGCETGVANGVLVAAPTQQLLDQLSRLSGGTASG